MNCKSLYSASLMLNRMYHVSCVSYSLKKQGMKLNKLLNPKQKREWYPREQVTDMLPTLKSLTRVQCEPGKQGIRRQAILNKMFMKYITDIMATGTVSMGVVGKGIEVSKVTMASNFKQINVYWVCKGDSRDEEIETLLNKIAGPLRHELSTLRIMGEVPYIAFVKDKTEAKLVDLDRRLKEADYGEAYTPTDMGHLLKTEFVLDTKLSPEMKAKIKQLEIDTPSLEDPLPEMTHNVFGLDHAKIMNRLVAARKRIGDAWANLDVKDSVILYRSKKNQRNYIAIEESGRQSQVLAEFLKKRQIQHQQIERRQKRDTREELMYVYDKGGEPLANKEQDVEERIKTESEMKKDDINDIFEEYSNVGSPRLTL